MKLLIVDDQATVVQGLLEGIDWKSVGIEQTIGAYSAAQAQQCLQAGDVDILLCDIEMPSENGLSLIAWMRERKLHTCVILLTAHAKFAYAQESVRLGVFDYILQPAPYAKIAATVEQAVQQVLKDRKARDLKAYGQEYIRQERTVVTAALWAWLSGKQNKREINDLADHGKIPQRRDSICLCLLQTLRWSKLTNWEPALFAYALQNILDEIFHPFAQHTIVVPMRRGEHAVLIWGKEYDLTMASVQRQMAFFQQAVRQYFQCELAVYLAGPILASQSRPVWEELCAAREDNVSREALIFLLDREKPQKNYHFFLPQLHDWVEQMRGDYPERIEQEACRLLDDLIAQGKMCAQTLRDFYQDFLQVVHLSMDGDESFWNQTLDQPENYEIYRRAPCSVEDMKKLIHLAVCHSRDRAATPEKELRQKVDAYIDDHMAEEIHREDLARAIYLNADYLNRIFKQETGHSLKEYVVQRKMEMARHLLRTTRLPVNMIAGRVGYVQVSYFSSVYKKIYGRTPMQERKGVEE